MTESQRLRNNKAHGKTLGELQSRMKTAEDTLDAIRRGQVDAIVVDGPDGDRLFTLAGSDAAYRVFVESMSEGAVTLGFFFSSRRRHTRSLRDWSSDVCSSD